MLLVVVGYIMLENINIVPHVIEGESYSIPFVYIHGYTIGSMNEKDTAAQDPVDIGSFAKPRKSLCGVDLVTRLETVTAHLPLCNLSIITH